MTGEVRSGLSVALPQALPAAGGRAWAAAGRHVVVPALALAGGAIYALAQPPFDRTAVCWVCLVPVLAAIAACRTARGGALCGLAFALLFSAIEAGWLPGAIAVFFGTSAVVGWLGALAVYLAFAGVPYALFGALAQRLLRRSRTLACLLGVPALVVLTEWVRTHVLWGLPWGLLGHALAGVPALIQIADVSGIAGVSFVIALVNGALLGALHARTLRAAVTPVVVALGVVGGVWCYGGARLAALDAGAVGRAVRVGVLQPNQAPVYHATAVSGDRTLQNLVRLSQQNFGGGKVDLVVWPEYAVPLYLERDAAAGRTLQRLAATLGAPRIVGAPATTDDEPRRYFNAAHLITPAGGATALYRKRRLVPFAEYPPVGFRGTGGTVFSAGDAPVLFDAAGVQWGPTICLDVIYPAVVRQTVRAGAEVLVNLSNDSWLAARGGGAAAQQLDQTIFRAVETRRDIVRATTTGISAVVDAGGRPRVMLGERQAGGVVALVQPRHDRTPYTRAGDLFVGLCLLAVLGLAWRGRAAAS